MDDQTLSEDATIAECFNEYFVNVATNLEASLPSPPRIHARSQFSNISSFFLRPVSIEECSRVINLKLTKTDLNYIPVKHFKSISPLILYPIVKILNQSFSLGVFPDILKIARVTQIFKSGIRL